MNHSQSKPSARRRSSGRAPRETKYQALAAVCILALGASQCAIIQPIRDPAMQLLRRGACISVDIPPITLTPERTAAERQLIGTEGEIESEGWLIASAQSASPEGRVAGGRAGGAIDPLNAAGTTNRRYRIEAGVLDFYHPSVLKFRRSELLGEGFDGRLRAVPANISRARFSEERDTAVEVAREVNRARLWIYEYLRSSASRGSDGAVDLRTLREQYLTRWYTEAQTRSGEWIYTEQKRWVRAR